MTDDVGASFSMLVMSVASSAAMALGLTPDPQSGKTETDKEMARFNIDLLLVLKEKTKNNLTQEETELLSHLLNDLQLKFVQFK
jgi:hypothetical protein